MGRLNGIIYALLKEDGRLKETNCPKCSQVLFEPDLKLLPRSEFCPACNAPLDENQMKMGDFVGWDATGKTESEEE